VSFPREIVSLHQIEITSRCSLKCVYCPSPAIVAGKYPDRKAVDMTRAHFERALDWAEFYVRRGTQNELNLAGIGESTIHPEFVDFVRLARERLGRGVKLVFATNGTHRDEEMIRAIAVYNPSVFVSLHRPEVAGPAIELYRKHGLLKGVSVDPSINANDWAGQTKWHSSGNRIPCQWLRDGKLMAMADGRLTRCCLDASGIGVLGHLDDEIGSLKTNPYALCKACYQDIPDPMWNQKEGAPR
jgi:hypothetical protein